jgi:hypothetical protein
MLLFYLGPQNSYPAGSEQLRAWFESIRRALRVLYWALAAAVPGLAFVLAKVRISGCLRLRMRPRRVLTANFRLLNLRQQIRPFLPIPVGTTGQTYHKDCSYSACST